MRRKNHITCNGPPAELCVLQFRKALPIGLLLTMIWVNATQGGEIRGIHAAARDGDIEEVKKIAAKNPESVNKPDFIQSNPPIYWAVSGCHKDVVEFLLAHGADVNAKDHDGFTALHWAVRTCPLDMADILLAGGAESDIFIEAATGRLEEVSKLVNDHPELVNARDNDNCTPLHFAAKFGNKDVCEYLIANGADVNVFDNGGDTPLHKSAYQGSKEVVDLLLSKGADVNARSKLGYGGTPLFMAAAGGHAEVVKLLLEQGADVNDSIFGYTPLHIASNRGQLEVAGLLIKRGAKVNARSEKGETPLHLAAEGGDYKEVVELLLAKGADINARDNMGKTPLHFAAFHGLKETAETLLNHGADVNAKDNEGNTPLKIAIKYELNELIELLRQHGAVE